MTHRLTTLSGVVKIILFMALFTIIAVALVVLAVGTHV